MTREEIEVCPHCDTEVTVTWDVEKDGYCTKCPSCGKELMLCDACMHSPDNSEMACDWCPNGCFRKTGDKTEYLPHAADILIIQANAQINKGMATVLGEPCALLWNDSNDPSLRTLQVVKEKRNWLVQVWVADDEVESGDPLFYNPVFKKKSDLDDLSYEALKALLIEAKERQVSRLLKEE